MSIKLRDIAYFLPKRVVTNEELHEENPAWDMDLVKERSGVLQRHIADDSETSLDLAYQACTKLFEANQDALGKIDGIMFCTQSEDYIMPPNSCILHEMLDLPEDVFAFDFNLACSGYIYGLALARGLVGSETAARFDARFVHSGPKPHVDLAGANRSQLLEAGLRPRNIHAVGQCSYCDSEPFFSYRREGESAGRMLAFIGLRPTGG